MKVSRIIAGVIVCALSCQLSWGQEASPAGARGALGYFDSATGVFRPVSPMEDFNFEALAATAQPGTIVVNFTIAIKSAIPANYLITCGVSAVVTEVSVAGVNLIEDDAAVAATRTGSTAKCTVTIPYSWVLSNPATARLSLNYSLTASKGTATTGLLARSSLGSIVNTAVPASGSTMTQTVNTVL